MDYIKHAMDSISSMKNTVFIVVIFLVLTASGLGTFAAYAQSASRPEEILMQKARSRYAQQKFPQASALYLEYLETWPEGVYAEEAEFFYGQVRFVLGDFSGCLESLRPQVDKSLSYRDQVLFYMGESAYLLRRNAESLTYFQWLLQEFPESEHADLATQRIGMIHFRQGNARLEMDDPAGALVHFQQAGSAPGEMLPLISYRIGECLARAGQVEDAEAVWRNLIPAADEGSWELGTVAMYRLAQMLGRQDRDDEALEIYIEMARRFPDHFLSEPALRRAIKMKVKAGEPAAAYECLDSWEPARLMQTQPELFEAGLFHLWHREYADAESAFAALAEAGYDPELRHLAARRLLDLLTRTGKPRSALEFIEQYAENRPEDYDDAMRLERAELHVELGDYPAAARALDRISFQADKSIRERAAFLKAALFYHQGRPDQAQTALSRYLATHKRATYAAEALFLRGQIRASSGSDDLAVTDLKSALLKAKSPELEEKALRLLVGLYTRQGLLDSAVASMQKLGELHQQRPSEDELHKSQSAALLFNKGEYEKGIELYEGIINGCSTERAPDYRFETGWGRYRLGQADQAREVFEELASAKGSPAVEAGLWLAVMDREAEEYQAALDRLSQIKDTTAEQSLRAEFERGMVLQAQGDTLAALALYRGMGKAHAGSGVYVKGRVLESLLIEGDTTGYLKELGLLEDRIEERLSAGYIIEQVRAAYQRGDQAAIEELAISLAVIALDETLVEEAELLRALLDYQQGRQKAAQRAMQGLYRRNPATPHKDLVLYYRGLGAFEKNDCQTAISDLESISYVSQPPERQADIDAILGQCWEKQDDQDKMEYYYTRLLQVDLSGLRPAEERVRVGVALKKIGKLDSAIQAFSQALSWDHEPKLGAEAQYWIGECFQEKGLNQRAAEEFLKVADQYPDQGMWATTAKFQAATLFESLGRYQKAEALYEMVVRESRGDRNREAHAKKRLSQVRKMMDQ